MTLWLIPEQTAFDTFLHTIVSLSEKYQTPQFHPHITLLPQINQSPKEIIDGVEKLIKGVGKFEVQPTTLNTKYSYFHNLYLLVEPNPTLNHLRQKARTIFHQNTSKFEQHSNYMPHFSLMYSDLSKEVIDVEMSRLQGSFEKKTTIDRLWIMNTTGKVVDWEIVEIFDL